MAQQLAYACNFGPPEGFARISNWTRNGSATEFDDYDGEHGDEYLKPLVETFNFARKVGKYVSEPMMSIGKSFLTGHGGNSSSQNEFNDRLVSFLADCLVSCRERLDLSDSELSGPARIGFRAVCRALRRKHCAFIVPSIFVPPRRVVIRHLELRQNELDCGDAVLLADALISQQSVVVLDLSSNRIGSRGMIMLCKGFLFLSDLHMYFPCFKLFSSMFTYVNSTGIVSRGMITLCKVLQAHESIRTFRVDKNRIGPAAGREIGLLLKKSSTLRVLSVTF